VCGLDPPSLGFTDSPATWGADILCGDIQSLGLGLHYGGAHGGLIANHDDERFIYEFTSRLFGLAPPRKDGEIGFVDVAYERTSLAMRDQGVEWVGTAAALWGITAGVYLALMGPHGMKQLGDTVASRTRYAMERLGAVPGITVHHMNSPHWREFLITFDNLTATEVNSKMLESDIYGGAEAASLLCSARSVGAHDQSLEASSIVCVTELHSNDDIDQLAVALERIMA